MSHHYTHLNLRFKGESCDGTRGTFSIKRMHSHQHNQRISPAGEQQSTGPTVILLSTGGLSE